MKKIIILLLIVACFSSCKGETKIKDNISHQILNKELSCEEILKKIIKSSDLNLKDYKDDYFIRIEDIQSDSITIQVYIKNNIAEFPDERQIVESTIAWLLFIPNEKKLLNITSDPDNPVILKYTYNFNQIYKYCGVSEQKEITSKKKDKECKQVSLEMADCEECLVRNIKIETVYNDIIVNKEIEESKYLLKELPIKNRKIKINENNLISINYIIKEHNQIVIELLYEGGNTRIMLEQINQNVRKNICYYFD